MKTLKLILVAAVFAIAMSSQGATGPLTAGTQLNVVYISVAQVNMFPGLAEAMHHQLRTDFLKKDQPIYTIEFRYGNFLLHIVGTYDQWSNFFWPKWVAPTKNRSDLPLL